MFVSQKYFLPSLLVFKLPSESDAVMNLHINITNRDFYSTLQFAFYIY